MIYAIFPVIQRKHLVGCSGIILKNCESKDDAACVSREFYLEILSNETILLYLLKSKSGRNMCLYWSKENVWNADKPA